VIHGFGGKTLATADLRRRNGRVGEVLSRMGFPYQWCVLARKPHQLHHFRSQGLTAKLNEFGAALEAHEIREIREAVSKHLKKPIG